MCFRTLTCKLWNKVWWQSDAKSVPILAWMSDLMLIKALFLVALTKNFFPPSYLFSLTRPVVIWFTGYEALQRVAETGPLCLCGHALLFMPFLKFTLPSVSKQAKNGWNVANSSARVLKVGIHQPALLICLIVIYLRKKAESFTT